MTGVGETSGFDPGGKKIEQPADTPQVSEVAAEFQAVFVQQLFKALRETVPSGSSLSGGAESDFFTDMMDQELANAVATRLNERLGLALERALSGLRHEVAAAGSDGTEEVEK